METLKRDWDSKLTLRDVLITISCLLIQPNPDSALNADAGALIQESYDIFAKRAELMTGIHAVIPKSLAESVREAQCRGQELQEEEEQSSAQPSDVPVWRRRTIARVRAARRLEASPTGAAPRRRHQPHTGHPFVLQADGDDVFGIGAPEQQDRFAARIDEEDEIMVEGEQENDSFPSPSKPTTPKPIRTPRRPHGVPIPLGELIMEHEHEDEEEDPVGEMESEYPPSPRKSPSKSPPKRKQAHLNDLNSILELPGPSRDAALRGPNITPPNFIDKPLAEDSPFMMDVTFDDSLSPRKANCRLFGIPSKRSDENTFEDMVSVTSGRRYGKMKGKRKSPSPAEREREAEQLRANADSKLWAQCGGDIRRWNRGDFDGEPFKKKAARW